MQLPDYDFKLLPEALKAAGIALGIFLVTLLLDFNDDLDAILTDPEAYIRSMVPALLAVVATAFLGVMTRRRNGGAETRLEGLKQPELPDTSGAGFIVDPGEPGESPFASYEEASEPYPPAEGDADSADVPGEPEGIDLPAGVTTGEAAEALEKFAKMVEAPSSEPDPGTERWIAVFVNGKERDRVLVPLEADDAVVLATATSSPAVLQFTEGKQLIRVDQEPGAGTLNLVVQ